jgi:hypothetical protein
MKITQSHYTFWMEKRTPTPTWAAPFETKRAKVSIHALINAQVEARMDTVVHNALQLVQLRRKNGDTPEAALEPSSWDKHNIPRRYFMFRRWQAKLRRSRRQ